MEKSIIETIFQTIQSEGATFLIRRQGSRQAPRFSTAVYRCLKVALYRALMTIIEVGNLSLASFHIAIVSR